MHGSGAVEKDVRGGHRDDLMMEKKEYFWEDIKLDFPRAVTTDLQREQQPQYVH